MPLRLTLLERLLADLNLLSVPFFDAPPSFVHSGGDVDYGEEVVSRSH
jgi:hypothetical protein